MADIIIELQIRVDKAYKDLDLYKKKLAGMTKVSSRQLNVLDRKLQNVRNTTQRLKNTISPIREEFQGWAMSIMFLGYAMQGFFNRLWMQGSKVFNDVQHSVAGTVTGFDHLNASLDYLYYGIGQAFEPVAMWFAGIIEAVAQWVNEQEGLTRWLLLGFGVLAGFLTLVGFGTLAIVNGIVPGLVKFWQGLVWVHGGIKAILAFKWGTTLTAWGTSIAAFGSKLWTIVTATWALIGPWLMLIGIIVTAIALGLSIGFTWKQIIDGWAIKFKLIANIAQDFFWGIAEWASGGVKEAINWINKLIEAWNWFASVTGWGAQIQTIDTTALDEASAKFRDERLKLAREYGELLMAGNKNEIDAAQNFKEGWQAVYDGIKNAGGSIAELFTGETEGLEQSLTNPMTAELAGSGTSTVNIGEINLSQQSGESTEAFMERILKELERNVRITA